MPDEPEDMRAPPLEGEVVQPGEDRQGGDLVPVLDMSIIGGLTRAEIDVQISTAHKYPRSIAKVRRMIETLATLDLETAMGCRFKKPQRVPAKDANGKDIPGRYVDGFIEGPSIRFAEAVMQAWGNGRVASRVTDQTETEIEATGIFHDLETNVAWAKSVRMPIVGSRGAKFPAHLITTTGNAAAAKAIRNAILAGIPRGVWNQAYEGALDVIKSEGAKALPERRKRLMAKAAEQGMSPQEVFDMLDVKGEDDITIDTLFTAAANLTAIADGETTLEEIIQSRKPPTDERGLTEAFGKASGKPTPEKAASGQAASPPKASAARTAAPASDTKASATAASTASPAATSGRQAPAGASSDGEKAGIAAGVSAESGQGGPTAAEVVHALHTGEADLQTDDQGKVVQLDERRAPAAEVAQPAAEEGEGTADESIAPEGESRPAEDVPDEATIGAFNGYAEEVQKVSTWPDLKGLVRSFRGSEAFEAASPDLRRQALQIAHNHALEKGLIGPEGLPDDVEWYRLWLVNAVQLQTPPEQIRAVFRKMARGQQYQGLGDAEKDVVVGETNDATGE